MDPLHTALKTYSTGSPLSVEGVRKIIYGTTWSLPDNLAFIGELEEILEKEPVTDLLRLKLQNLHDISDVLLYPPIFTLFYTEDKVLDKLYLINQYNPKLGNDYASRKNSGIVRFHQGEWLFDSSDTDSSLVSLANEQISNRINLFENNGSSVVL